MREAFCAVHLTLRWLHFSRDDYFDALDGGRISKRHCGIETLLRGCYALKLLMKRRLVRVYLEEAFSRLRGDTTADDVAYAPTSAPTEGNEAKRLHFEGHGNNEQEAPNEAIKKDHDSIDGNVLIPFASHTGEPSQTKEGNEDFSRPNKKDHDRIDGNVINPFANHTEVPSQTKEGNEDFSRLKNVPRTELKDRNDTARTELEISVDDSSQGTNRCTLPSPRTEHVSLLNIDEPKRWMRRRKINKWTNEEENALAEGVRKYGYQWTRILETYQEISRERTAVDLKDKWRNLQRK
ncbi:hypothetical protein F3Y22_tig00003194pilonHSYRG00003 [Hibiscus syriacus]|uniref:Uncharacterized protein n=1 Tax=Hibiscus syriacus TaxID=106335 RepID=A0A6A3CK88_HIBSY|nr:hypothetical protein F3Y22_tig00003194pilonHSYRG00003 [Hibiscus syriacus]